MLQEQLDAVATLLQNLGDRSGQALPVFVREVPRGNHNDGQISKFHLTAAALQKFEPVHLRHHQVEQHQAVAAHTQALQSLAAVGDLVHPPAGFLKGTPQQFAEQATNIAAQGQTADPPPTEDWKPIGVFALVQGSETSSNNIFQLAVNKDGIVRGNYYDGLTDASTPVYGSVDKKSQRVAWTIGKNKDRVYESGVYNLTQDQSPCLVHLGTAKTNQMLLVRMQQPASSANRAETP